jgi:thermolabile hemolysin
MSAPEHISREIPMKGLRLLCGLVLVLSLVSGSSSHADIVQLVVFGDSLLDTGNVYTATNGQQPPPPYFNGRFSNGIVWNEYLAAGLHIAAATPSLTGGTNYAWGGAESGTGVSPQNGVPNVLTQVGQFLSGNTLSSNQLVVMDGGANDFFDGQTDPNVPVNNLATAITSLAAAGGKQFLVQNLPPLGNVPGSLSLPQGQRDALNALTLAYDALLDSRLAQLRSSLGISIKEVDLNSLVNTIDANPAAYGFTNTTTSALGDGVLSGQGYLFWDDVHPTTAGHAIIGNAALAALAPAVPEPSTYALAGVFGVAGALTAWIRRKRLLA